MKEGYKVMLIWDALGIPQNAKYICAVGSGGKTSLLNGLAKWYHQKGKKVLVTTTTKMYLPKNHVVLQDDIYAIQEGLQSWGLVVAGIPIGDNKIKGLSAHILQKASQSADMVLMEADGSKRLPLKLPNQSEPVLPSQCDFLITVVGLSALGKPLQNVCHRYELAEKWSNQDLVNEHMIAKILEWGYTPYWRQYNGCVFANQADCVMREQAIAVGQFLRVPYVFGSVQKEVAERKEAYEAI